VVEGRRAEPLLELRFFRSPPFSAANGIAVISSLALSGFLFINTLYLQQVRGDSALAGAIASTARQTGNTLGVAIMGSMIANSGVGASGLTTNVDPFLALTRAPWLLVVGCGFARSLLAAVCTGPRGQRLAARVTDSGH